ncbi:aldo/keto reductase [Massilia oculi]|uniref:aldo/keto reductase n=1 Tax=Massilia oculi TaxID=945844 RepID=UPI0026BC5D94|nr:aldo/keto reductase [Massilia oculi]
MRGARREGGAGRPVQFRLPGGGPNYDYGPADEDKIARRERLRQVAARHGVDLPAAALQFGLAHPVVTATIPGASSVAHLQRNAALMDIVIPPAFWEELKAEGLLAREAPLPNA